MFLLRGLRCAQRLGTATSATITPPFCRHTATHTKHSPAATSSDAAVPIKYTDTINLPKTKFPARLSAAKRTELEAHINSTANAALYDWQRRNLTSTADDFVLHDGPPYANGDLHMGHAINKILKDIILRQHVIAGRRVHFRPGWDCHGLPIELKAMQSAPDASAADPLDVRRRARSFAAATIDRQRQAFADWGVMADWTRAECTYRTMDAAYVRGQLRAFARLHRDGFVYRDHKPVYWSPSSRTALAEAELEYDQQHRSPSLTLRVRLSAGEQLRPALASAPIDVHGDRVFALIWTTTPWSLPANQAICVAPELRYSVVRLHGHRRGDFYLVASALLADLPVPVDECVAELAGSDLVGLRYRHPVNATDERGRIYGARHVQASKGTGLVHTAPAHGPDDFLVGLEQRLPLRALVDDDGRYNAAAPEFVRGHSVLGDGNRLLLERVADDVVHVGELQHSYPIDWRTKQPVLIRASQQWFIDTERLKAGALDAVDRVAVFPARTALASKAQLTEQLRRRPYWCISRQRAWGTPIPVLYNRHTGAEIVDDRIVDAFVERLREPGASADLWWTSDIADLCPAAVRQELGLSAGDLRRGTDILDIWFDSGISWSFALDANADGRRIADLYLEGHDQFTGWFQSSLMTSVALQRCAPYRALFVHGFAVDETGAKMSKSLGNTIVPGDIIGRYGVDTLRWWVAHHAVQHTSIPVGQATLQGAADAVQKCRQTMRYLLGCVSAETAPFDASDAALRAVDRQFVRSLADFERDIREHCGQHQYNRAAAAILHFVSSDMSAGYLHVIKDRLYCGRGDEVRALRTVLRRAYETLSRVLWPITPFMVEECWSHFDRSGSRTFYEHAAKSASGQTVIADDAADADAVMLARELKAELNQRVRDANLWTKHVTVTGAPDQVWRLQELHSADATASDSELSELLQVGAVTLRCDASADAGGFVLESRDIEGGLCPRCRRFGASEGAVVCTRCATVLQERASGC